MLQKHVHVMSMSFNLNIRVTIIATVKKVSLSSSDAAMCKTCKKKLFQPSNPKPSAELCHPRHEWRVDSQGLQEVKCHNGFGWAKKRTVEYWHKETD